MEGPQGQGPSLIIFSGTPLSPTIPLIQGPLAIGPFSPSLPSSRCLTDLPISHSISILGPLLPQSLFQGAPPPHCPYAKAPQNPLIQSSRPAPLRGFLSNSVLASGLHHPWPMPFDTSRTLPVMSSAQSTYWRVMSEITFIRVPMRKPQSPHNKSQTPISPGRPWKKAAGPLLPTLCSPRFIFLLGALLVTPAAPITLNSGAATPLMLWANCGLTAPPPLIS